MPAERQGRLLLAALLLAATAACSAGRDAESEAARLTGGDPRQGPARIRKYGCDACHTIPGVRTAHGTVGPPLTGIGSRAYLAGRLPNTPDNLVTWIQHPHQVDPKTAMPETGIGEADARHIAAYLYTLR
jgi:cytochrome c